MTQTHSGSGNNVNIQALGSGDAFGGDKILGSKFVGGTHYHGSQPEPRKAPPEKFINWQAVAQHFLERPQFMEAIHRRFFGEEVGKVCITQAITGLGGIGKTQMALRYAEMYQSEYCHVIFLSADSLSIGIQALVEALGLPGQSEDEKTAALRHWMSRKQEQPWLMILDNADSEEAFDRIGQFLGNQRYEGHFLYTSRRNDTGRWRLYQTVELSLFTEEEALAFLEQRTGLPPDDDARKLARALDGLPLALEQAGALIHAKRWSYARYMRKFLEDSQRYLEEGVSWMDLPPERRREKQVAVTWNANLDEIREQDARFGDFLNLCGMMAPEVIPLSWVSRGLAATEPEVYGALSDDEEVLDFLRELDRYSLLKIGETGFQLHRLVQAVIRQPLPEETKAACHLRCIQAVIRTAPESNQIHTWDKGLYAQGLFLAQCVWNQDGETMALLCNQAGYYAQNTMGVLKEAEPLYVKALEIRESLFGEHHPDTVRSYNNLGLLYQEQGDYTRAEPLLVKALEINESVLGVLDPATALSCNNLGALYDSQGDYVRAKPLYLKALEIYESVFGESHPDTALSYNNLGVFYQAQGDYVRAEPLYLKALEIYESVFGENHPDTARSYNNLGYLYDSQADYVRAEPLYLKALEIYESVFGESHPDTACSYNNLGGLYESQGDYVRAEPLYLKALEIRESLFGERHPATTLSCNNLGALYQAQGDYVRAEPLLKKALEITEGLFGERHPDTARSYNNVGGLYKALGDYGRAEPLYLKALEITECVFGAFHPATAHCYNNLGALYDSQGDYVRAEPLLKKALVGCLQTLGPDHPNTRTVRDNITSLYQAMGLDDVAAQERIQALFEKLASDDMEDW